MVVLDTHAWIWCVDNPDMLSGKGREFLDRASRDEPLLVSSISAWEVHMLEAKGRLKFKTDSSNWVRRCEDSGIFRFIPVDNEIARISVQLEDYGRPDPADRIIMATARVFGVPLLSKDRKILDYAGVTAIW